MQLLFITKTVKISFIIQTRRMMFKHGFQIFGDGESPETDSARR